MYPPTLFDETPRLRQVSHFTGQAVQADQGNFDLLMSICTFRSGRAEVLHNAIRSSPGDLQQAVAAGGNVVRDACFDQMTMAVQFVLDLQVGPPRGGEVDLVVGVQVAIGA